MAQAAINMAKPVAHPILHYEAIKNYPCLLKCSKYYPDIIPSFFGNFVLQKLPAHMLFWCTMHNGDKDLRCFHSKVGTNGTKVNG